MWTYDYRLNQKRRKTEAEISRNQGRNAYRWGHTIIMQSLEPSKRQALSLEIQILFLMLQHDWRLLPKRLLIRATGHN